MVEGEVDVVHIMQGVVDLQVLEVLGPQLQQIYKGKGHIQLSKTRHIFTKMYSEFSKRLKNYGHEQLGFIKVA